MYLTILARLPLSPVDDLRLSDIGGPGLACTLACTLAGTLAGTAR